MIAWIKKLFRREKVIPDYRTVTFPSTGQTPPARLLPSPPPSQTERHAAVIESLRTKTERAQRLATAAGLKASSPVRPANRQQAAEALRAGYKPVVRREGDVTRRTYEPTKDTSSDDIYLAMAAAMLLTDPPAPSPASCSAPSFSSGGGGDYGGGGASGSWDSGSSSSSDSSSSSSDSGSSSSSSD